MNVFGEGPHGITPEQYTNLMRPLNGSRVAKRRQGGKDLSYLESWDVRAHLIRTFGFGNFDAQIIKTDLMFQRDITIGANSDNPRPGWEVAYKVEFALTIRDPQGDTIAVYVEAAVGSAEGSVGLGDLHDNALKTAASDALKRCAINLGSQFGLSLYDGGSLREVIRGTLVKPDGWEPPEDPQTPEQSAALAASVGTQNGQQAAAQTPPASEEPDSVPDGDGVQT